MKKACEHMNLKSKLAHRFQRVKQQKINTSTCFQGYHVHIDQVVYISKVNKKWAPTKLIDMEFS
jgi:hypothetical protein